MKRKETSREESSNIEKRVIKYNMSTSLKPVYNIDYPYSLSGMNESRMNNLSTVLPKLKTSRPML